MSNSELYHYGRKGMKWYQHIYGEADSRGKYNKYIDEYNSLPSQIKKRIKKHYNELENFKNPEDKELKTKRHTVPKGTVLKSYRDDNTGVMRAVYKDLDSDFLKGPLKADKERTFITNRPLVIAGKKELREEIMKIYNKELERTLKKVAKQKVKDSFGPFSNKELTYKEYYKTVMNDITRNTVQNLEASPKTKKLLIENLRSQGYDGFTEIGLSMDSADYTDPLVLFENPAKSSIAGPPYRYKDSREVPKEEQELSEKKYYEKRYSEHLD